MFGRFWMLFWCWILFEKGTRFVFTEEENLKHCGVVGPLSSNRRNSIAFGRRKNITWREFSKPREQILTANGWTLGRQQGCRIRTTRMRRQTPRMETECRRRNAASCFHSRERESDAEEGMPINHGTIIFKYNCDDCVRCKQLSKDDLALEHDDGWQQTAKQTRLCKCKQAFSNCIRRCVSNQHDFMAISSSSAPLAARAARAKADNEGNQSHEILLYFLRQARR